MSDFRNAWLGAGGGTARRGLVTALLTVLCLVSVQGCGGDDNAGTTVVDYCGEFDSSQVPASGRVVARVAEDSTCNLVGVEIVATDIDDVAAFFADITYDPSFALFVTSSAAGSVLTSDGSQVAVIPDEPVLGQLTIGISRVAQTGIDIDGTELVATLFFLVDTLDSHSGQITISNECLLGGDPPNPKPGLICAGGTLRVR